MTIRFQSAKYRDIARKAALRRLGLRAEDGDQTETEELEEALSAAREQVEVLEKELADAKQKEKEGEGEDAPEKDEAMEARLGVSRIYARMNGRHR